MFKTFPLTLAILAFLSLTSDAYSQQDIRSLDVQFFGNNTMQTIQVEVKKDKMVYLEDDMILGYEKDIFPKNNDEKAPLIYGSNYRWESAVIPFEIEANHSKKSEILAAIDHINSNTNLRIIPRNSSIHNDYVNFKVGSGCASFIGRIGGAQSITIGNCSFSAIVHEILHAAGLFHEHARKDRNDHIIIQWQNIRDGKEGNFQTYEALGYPGYDYGDYDYQSIMHYHNKAFSKNGQPTIIPRNAPANTTLGNTSGMSASDIKTINSVYAPDLTIDNLDGLPSSISSGGIVSFYFDIINQGTSDVLGGYEIRKYLSKDKLFSTDDVLAGTLEKSTTPVGMIPLQGGLLFIDDDMPSGDYYVILIIDYLNEIEELKENNNQIVSNSTLQVIHPSDNLGTLTIECPLDIYQQVMLPQTANWGAIEVIKPIASTSCNQGGLSIELMNTNLNFGLQSPPVPYVSAGQQKVISYRISDHCGNEQICTYTITSEILPTYLTFTYCPSDLYITIPSDEHSVPVDYPVPSVQQENCGADVILFRDPSTPSSGSEFQVGRTEIRYIAQNQCTSAVCSFDIIVEKEDAPPPPSSANCNEIEANFNFVGQHRNHYYYHSKDIVNANAAYSIAKDLGGDLIMINDESENDFIQNQLVGMTYIGLSDKIFEGYFQWSDETPMSYSNFDICGFCEGNSAFNDYVVMHQWDGKWSFTNKWSKRYFIIEFETDPCSNDIDNEDDLQFRFAEDPFVVEDAQINHIYPNPARDYINIDIDSPDTKEITLELYDIRGVQIYKKKLPINAGRNTITEYLNDLNSGMYFLKIQDNTRLLHTQKLTKI